MNFLVEQVYIQPDRIFEIYIGVSADCQILCSSERTIDVVLGSEITEGLVGLWKKYFRYV